MDLNNLKTKVLSALGQASDATRELAGKAADVTKDFAGKAADKAKAGGRIAKLNIEIAQEKENMKKTYVEIGKLYYDTHKDDPDGFFIQLCDEISLAKNAIADKEAEIDELKASFGDEETDPDIEVEFEEIVSEEETAAEAEATAEPEEASVEEVIEAVESTENDAEE